jgi:transposase-like protein
MAELVLEAERIGQSKVCQREGIAPAQLSRWKEKLLKGGIAALKQMKTGPRQKVDPEIAALHKETERQSVSLSTINQTKNFFI